MTENDKAAAKASKEARLRIADLEKQVKSLQRSLLVLSQKLKSCEEARKQRNARASFKP